MEHIQVIIFEMSQNALKKMLFALDYAMLIHVFVYIHLKLISPDHLSS